MLTGTVPFSGSSPLAIAVKQTSEYPRPPREIVAAIPDDLEKVVLHALEKDAKDRPANAAEFRSELLEVAEKLGLEHHALISSPDLAALRDVGVESPSGRLIVDLSRLREGRVLTSGQNETTVLAAPNRTANNNFSRMEIWFRRGYSGKLVVVAMVLFALMVSGILFFASKARKANVPAATTNVDPSATPQPSALPSPSPTATQKPRPSPSPEPSASPSPSPEKKRGKVGSVMNKVKRILTKPF
jgi:hypothetical protein